MAVIPFKIVCQLSLLHSFGCLASVMDLFAAFCLALIQLNAVFCHPTTTDLGLSPYSTEPTLRLGDTGKSRQPRRIIRKIQSGIAFLAGVKVGALLANKGFDAGHGSLAASNSFQLFGKNVNSALSLSYGGGTLQKLPLLDDAPLLNDTAKPKKEDVVHLTVVHNPSPDTIDKLRRISNVTVAAEPSSALVGDDLVIVDSVEERPADSKEEEKRFIEEHNRRVMELNKELTRRRNSRF